KAEKILDAQLSINLLRYTKVQGKEFYRQGGEKGDAVPGVEAASLARVVPMSGQGRTSSLFIQGRQGPDNVFRSEGDVGDQSESFSVASNVVAIDYFKTMGIPLLQGRDFTAQDKEGALPVVIVNQAFGREYFKDE